MQKKKNTNSPCHSATGQFVVTASILVFNKVLVTLNLRISVNMPFIQLSSSLDETVYITAGLKWQFVTDLVAAKLFMFAVFLVMSTDDRNCAVRFVLVVPAAWILISILYKYIMLILCIDIFMNYAQVKLHGLKNRLKRTATVFSSNSLFVWYKVACQCDFVFTRPGLSPQ